ncbi:conserved hypothetical protein [Beutenbergia cavernae DSM 12333]|uniref:Secreted protein n=1 Tax=Beutenbergia cavernae (strain ATCC BAA-8 / DSM 12333 / CCUG 43141 / JCM 11478 / NBRC 16432 / NCIMB 13614 / HKI 0122) TaxID=471853 RepID=C5C3F3_BEUC1|nr:conserved hypothetical protein [Beutenbergia cavernae DSM 12333]
MVSVLGGALLASTVLGACASPVGLDPAPDASAPICAEVLRALPGSLAGAERRETTSQASRAWGDPPITLRCGVEPPGPTTDRCITVEAADGTSIDWVVAENDDVGPDAGSGQFAFTTYGRVPAVEVVVPVEYAGDDATSLLLDVGTAVGVIPQDRECLSLDDVS